MVGSLFKHLHEVLNLAQGVWVFFGMWVGRSDSGGVMSQDLGTSQSWHLRGLPRQSCQLPAGPWVFVGMTVSQLDCTPHLNGGRGLQGFNWDLSWDQSFNRKLPLTAPPPPVFIYMNLVLSSLNATLSFLWVPGLPLQENLSGIISKLMLPSSLLSLLPYSRNKTKQPCFPHGGRRGATGVCGCGAGG